MAFIRYQKFGKKEYAYEITAYWDKNKKSCRQKTRYLGAVIDKTKKIFEKKQQIATQEKLILDFGDSFALNDFLKNSGFNQLIETSFGQLTDDVLALIQYRLCYGSAMTYAQKWFEGSYAKIKFKEANLSSQRISELFEQVGNEQQQRMFFKEYFKQFTASKEGIIIDATSLPNQIHMPLTEWGRSGEEIDKQMRFLLVVDKQTGLPLYFRNLPGNIIDVSTLRNTIDELQKYGVENLFIYSDAGFFSEDNIIDMYKNNINFLTRLPATRTIYKELIQQEVKNLESFTNGVRYGKKRSMFIKQKEIELFGRKAFAHIVLDPKRKGREMDRFILENLDEKDKNKDELEYQFLRRGVMVLISSFEIPKEEVVPAYYVRQTAEMLFGFSKDDLDILPLRVHNEARVRGFLLLQFLSLIAFTQLKNKLGKEYTVEEALLSLRNLKAKVYEKDIIVSELNKEQKEITSKMGVIVSKNLGI